jgi:hypothetical protein
MGNVLGFVRLMRHAVRHVGAAAAVPLASVTPESLVGFRDLEIPASPASAEATAILQTLVRNLQQRSDGGEPHVLSRHMCKLWSGTCSSALTAVSPMS